jgi:hypothetical protein
MARLVMCCAASLLFPLIAGAAGKVTKEALKAGGFSPEPTEISGHTHWYYDRAPQINRAVWTFLRDHALTSDARYEHHYFAR